MDKLFLMTDGGNTYEVKGIGAENFGSGTKSSDKTSACNFSNLAMGSRCLHINMQGLGYNQLKKITF